MWSKANSGLKINLEKSQLIPVGVVTNMENLARVLGCSVGTHKLSRPSARNSF